MSEDKLKVCEIFSTVQGEGRFSGYPVIFIRLFGANITDKEDPYRYAWDTNTKEENQKVLLITDVIEAIDKLDGNKEHWVIGGGEPLMQQEKLVELIMRYKSTHENNLYIEIETNGTIKPIPKLDSLVQHYNVNLLISNSTNTDSKADFNQRIKEEPMYFFNSHFDKVDFKFLIAEAEDVKEVKEIQEMYKIPNYRVWLLPKAVDHNFLKRKSAPIWKYCIKDGYKYSNRAQLFIYGPQKQT